MLEFNWVRGLGLGLTFAIATGFAARPAAAQEAPAPEETATEPAAPASPPPINLTGGPTIDLSTPAPPPPTARTYQLHQGFYLRLDAGLGWLFGTADAGGTDITTDGLALNYDLLIGGSPAPGFSIGAGIIGALQLSGDWETADGGSGGSGDMVTMVIGPFADGFPDAKGGWHFGGIVGLARTSIEVPNAPDDDAEYGVGGAFWAGHDVWVAPEWSIGGLLRLDALRTSKDDVTTTGIGISLMFTVLYN